MKKLALIVLLVVGLSTYAQEEKKQERQGAARERLSPEQRNQLQLKKITLDLNLNESQQKEIAKILEEQSAKRQAEMATFKANKEKGVKPTAEERFAMKNKKLDEAIAVKAKVQKVLTPEQFKKWEDIKKENRENMKERMEKRRDKKSAE
jgi:protein CpxP